MRVDMVQLLTSLALRLLVVKMTNALDTARVHSLSRLRLMAGWDHKARVSFVPWRCGVVVLHPLLARSLGMCTLRGDYLWNDVYSTKQRMLGYCVWVDPDQLYGVDEGDNEGAPVLCLFVIVRLRY